MNSAVRVRDFRCVLCSSCCCGCFCQLANVAIPEVLNRIFVVPVAVAVALAVAMSLAGIKNCIVVISL